MAKIATHKNFGTQLYVHDFFFFFCDVSKASDRVWHTGLLVKLQQYGISGNLLNGLTVTCHTEKKTIF